MNDEQKRAYDQFCKVDFSSLIEWYFSLSGYEVAIAAGAFAMIISKPLNYVQQEALANLFTMVGHTILIVASQKRAAIELKSVHEPMDQETTEYLYGPIPEYAPPPNLELEMLKAQVAQLTRQVQELKKR